tara:strand:+ start:5132 stop:5317 length:186 start_codon:yes stop_codon:yes gene_type:complete
MEEEKYIIEYNRLVQKTKTLQDKFSIAIQGLEALHSGGEPTGIAKTTLDAIKSLDLPQDDI